MAGGADHKGLAPPVCHRLHPFELRLPGRIERCEVADLVTAPSPFVRRARPPRWSRRISSLPRAGSRTGGRSVRTAFFCRLSGIPPNVATSGLRPSARSTRTCMHLRGPCGVSIVAACLRAIFETDEPFFQASVLSSEVDVSQCSRFSRRHRRPSGSTGRCPGTRHRSG